MASLLDARAELLTRRRAIHTPPPAPGGPRLARSAPPARPAADAPTGRGRLDTPLGSWSELESHLTARKLRVQALSSPDLGARRLRFAPSLPKARHTPRAPADDWPSSGLALEARAPPPRGLPPAAAAARWRGAAIAEPPPRPFAFAGRGRASPNRDDDSADVGSADDGSGSERSGGSGPELGESQGADSGSETEEVYASDGSDSGARSDARRSSPSVNVTTAGSSPPAHLSSADGEAGHQRAGDADAAPQGARAQRAARGTDTSRQKPQPPRAAPAPRLAPQPASGAGAGGGAAALVVGGGGGGLGGPQPQPRFYFKLVAALPRRVAHRSGPFGAPAGHMVSQYTNISDGTTIYRIGQTLNLSVHQRARRARGHVPGFVVYETIEAALECRISAHGKWLHAAPALLRLTVGGVGRRLGDKRRRRWLFSQIRPVEVVAEGVDMYLVA